MSEQEKLSDENIIDRMLACETIEEWNNAREFSKMFRGQKWISVNIDAGLIRRVTLRKQEFVLPNVDDVPAPKKVARDASVVLSNGSNALRDWYRQQKNQY